VQYGRGAAVYLLEKLELIIPGGYVTRKEWNGALITEVEVQRRIEELLFEGVKLKSSWYGRSGPSKLLRLRHCAAVPFVGFITVLQG
jgi:hypothetical protein